MNNEIQNENKTLWFENYTTKEYLGIEYLIYENTPEDIVFNKIKTFIDELNLKTYGIDLNKIEVITEGSKAVLVDVWVYDVHVCKDKILIEHDFMISRKKDNNKKYGYRVRYIL